MDYVQNNYWENNNHPASEGAMYAQPTHSQPHEQQPSLAHETYGALDVLANEMAGASEHDRAFSDEVNPIKHTE